MATKKTTAKKNTLNKNVERIQKTAKSVNSEVSKTAEAVVDNMKTDSKQLRALASKTAKEANKKIDLRKNVEMIRKTTTSVNQQVWKTAEAVVGDLTETGKAVVKDTTAKAKKAVAEFDLAEQAENVKTAASKANETALKTADQVVDSAYANGEKWQDVAAKAMKGSLKLAGRQQEIVFDTLEIVKGQLLQSASRFRKIMSSN